MKPIKRNREKYLQAANEYQQDLNCTLTYLADKYNCTRQQLSLYFKSIGIKVRVQVYNKEHNDELDAAVKHYVNTNDSIEITASQYNIDQRTLQARLKKLKLTRNSFDQKNYKIDEDYFQTINTAKKAYWLGFLMADGCVRFAARSAQITLEIADQDYLHLQKYKEDLSFTGPIVSRKNRKISSVRITRLKMANDLAAKGCVQDKTHQGWINLQAIFGFEKDFIRGYCDGNGYIDRTRTRVIFTMGSENISRGLLELLSKYNPLHRVDSRLSSAGNPTYRVTIENETGFYEFLQDIYLNAEVYLNRKMLVALQRLDAHYGQLLSEDHRKIMRNLAGKTQEG